jgi:hypothetical protein
MSQGREAFNKIREVAGRIGRTRKAVQDMQERMAIAARDGSVYMPRRMAQAPAASPEYSFRADEYVAAKKKGGVIKSSASKRADGCAKRGKTKCKMV